MNTPERCRILVPVIALLLAVSAVHAQSEWSVTNLDGPINTVDHEAFPTITKSGLVLYFARRTVNADDAHTGWDIWVSERPDLDAPWGEPRRLPDHINTDGEEHSVSFSPDGHWLYFSSTKLGSFGGFDIFRSYREDVTDELAWGAPMHLGPDVNTAEHDVCVIYHADERTNSSHLYFVSNREGGTGKFDMWKVSYDPSLDTYGEAEEVASVSSSAHDFHLDPEAGYVWTMREGGYGKSDIWHSDRDADGNWLPPVNLGPSINTEFEEQLPSPFDHGRIIYFPSDRPGGLGGLDLYVAERSEVAR